MSGQAEPGETVMTELEKCQKQTKDGTPATDGDEAPPLYKGVHVCSGKQETQTSKFLTHICSNSKRMGRDRKIPRVFPAVLHQHHSYHVSHFYLLESFTHS